jgi:hypothetical protein
MRTKKLASRATVDAPRSPATSSAAANRFPSCALPGVQSFCCDVSGTWSGTISRGLGPNSAAADFRFRLDDGDGPTVEALTGCRIIAWRAAGAGDQAYADFFGSTLSGSMLETTIDCPAATGFGTVDLGVGIYGERTLTDAARPPG